MGAAGAGGAGAVAGASGSGGLAADCSAPTNINYEIRRVQSGSSLTIDGTCDETSWQAAPLMKFVGPSNTDNSTECRLLWDPSGSPRMFGCCVITDTDLQGVHTAHDSKVFNDDSVEYFLRPAPDASLTAGTVKIFINLLGTVYDQDFPGYNPAYEAGVLAKASLDGTLNDSAADKGYTLEWSSVVSPLPLTTTEYRCAFATNDTDGLADGGSTRTSAISFPGPSNTINDLETWGKCSFSCLEAGQ